MKNLLRLFLLAAAALPVASCIDNDIPYPVVELNITGIEGEGFALRSIDATSGTVFLKLDEQTDIRHVSIDAVTLGCVPHSTSLTSEELTGQIRLSRPLTGEFDLRTPLEVTLSLYADYAWSIVAEQEIERRFSVAGQVGAARFDPENRIATAFVSKNADRSQTTVTELKLGPANTDARPGVTLYSMTPEELSALDFSAPEGSDPDAGTPRFVDVTLYADTPHARTERWVLYVLPTEQSVELLAADAWSRVVWLYGSGIEGMKSGFLCRRGEEEEWQEVPDVVTEGGTFRARFAAEESTRYQFAAYCGEERTDPVDVTTDPVAQLPNLGFEEWCTIRANNYDVVYPFADGAEPYWGTGNVGAGLAKATLTDKSEDIRPGSEGRYSALLQSKYVNVSGVGKFGAGNLFTGRYVRSAVTDGILTFGRPFELRPTALRVWVKYTRGDIDRVKSMPVGTTIRQGDPDNGHIYVALGTWTPEEYGRDSEGVQVGTDASPICVDTRDVSTFFRPDGKDVVGFGQLILGDSDDWQDITQWREAIVPIEYRNTETRPTHIMIVCSASRWGDYFTGSSKSCMQVDDFELLYD